MRIALHNRKSNLQAVLCVVLGMVSCSGAWPAPQENSGIPSALLARAKAGDPAAEAGLGYAYQNTSEYVDRKRAAYWYRKAAAAGNPDGEEGWAVICEYDFDDPDHYAKAAGWFQKAAEQGNIAAEKDLGAAYEMGKGVPQNYARAAYWYGKAAEQGDPFAEYRLGELYLGGEGVPLDPEEAHVWLTKAAMDGDSDAQVALSGEADVDALLAGIKAEHHVRQKRIALRAILAALGCLGLYTLLRQRRRLLRVCRRAMPKSPRARQLSIILPAACWCSACCLYQVVDPIAVQHPVNAAVAAVLYSAPAVIFGAVGLWCLSSDRKQTQNERSIGHVSEVDPADIGVLRRGRRNRVADGSEHQQAPVGSTSEPSTVAGSESVAHAGNDLPHSPTHRMRAELELSVEAAAPDHDHFCDDCFAYIGCPRPYCGLPTENRCIDHGGWPFAASATHVHECFECDYDGEQVSVFDWVHEDAECRQPRRWNCPEHRTTAVNGVSSEGDTASEVGNIHFPDIDPAS